MSINNHPDTSRHVDEPAASSETTLISIADLIRQAAPYDKVCHDILPLISRCTLELFVTDGKQIVIRNPSEQSMHRIVGAQGLRGDVESIHSPKSDARAASDSWNRPAESTGDAGGDSEQPHPERAAAQRVASGQLQFPSLAELTDIPGAASSGKNATPLVISGRVKAVSARGILVDERIYVQFADSVEAVPPFQVDERVRLVTVEKPRAMTRIPGVSLSSIKRLDQATDQNEKEADPTA